MINDRLIVAGFGGQGVLMIGKMVALSGMERNLNVSWLPSYSSEMRGGTANCNVIVSEDEVDSPMVSKPNFLIVMNYPSFAKFGPRVVPGGKMLVNSSLVHEESDRKDIEIYRMPFNDLAAEAQNERGMNMLVAGAYAALSGTIDMENIFDAIEHTFTDSKAKFVDGNKAMAKLGYDYAVKHFRENERRETAK